MIRNLVKTLSREKENIFIQTHNFPDPDAVASAYGLQQLLEQEGIQSKIIYDGVIQRTALNKMIRDLSIDIRHSSDHHLTERDKIIIVDGCKRNNNVTDLIGEEIAVIDHHPGKEPDDVPFVDIRPEAGACASIITQYYNQMNQVIPINAATALLTGLFRDTDSMTRGMSPLDVEAYSTLYMRADNRKVNSMVLNNITLEDLQFYNNVIKNLKTEGDIAFCYIREECDQNLLGILGDFLLSLEEVKFSALFARNSHLINISFRNESPHINAAEVIKELVEGIGSGGGHRQMAGGVIDDRENFNPEEMFQNLVNIISR